MSVRRVVLVVAAATVGLGIEWLGYGGSIGLAAADFVVGVAFLVCGLVVRERRGDSRIALLFLTSGLAWFLGTLAGSDVGAISSAGAALLYVHRGPFVHLILAYPTGHVRSGLDRMVVAIAYVDGLVISVAQNDVLTIGLAGMVVAAGAGGLRGQPPNLRKARALATGVAALVGAALVLGSASRLAGTTAFSDSLLLVTYEATLVVAAFSLAGGLLVNRPQRAAVADIVVELEAMPRSETLRDALSRAFADPALEIGYWLDGSYVDGEGRTMMLPPAGADRVVTLIEHDGQPVAVLVHDAATGDDPELGAAVVAAARLTASNARLQAELRARLAELGASRRRALQAGDAQRRRLERRLSHAADLHLAEMRSALTRALKAAPTHVVDTLTVAVHELDEAAVEIHELARGIHPHTLTETGLAPALTELATTSPIRVSVGAPSDRFSPQAEVTAYFVCAEALTNVAKYAQTNQASIEIRRDDDRLAVMIIDDGIGGADPAHGSGLRGLADRVEAVGGHLTVTSPSSRGTQVFAEIPLEQAV